MAVSPGDWNDSPLLQVEYAPINANDLLLIKGTFHYTPSLPTIVGNEGVGRVLAIGPDVQSVKVGDRVLLPLYSNSWRERIVVPTLKLVPIPPEADVQFRRTDRPPVEAGRPWKQTITRPRVKSEQRLL